ncbi:hypothetical protein SAMN05720473_1013 [Fibrobacter sp. UWB15]|nr:hypothetical protein BGW99_1013 [Fibrobacter sp. UWB6]SMG06940.1 hypothetical protein SAMN05720473_1013 [Fibrobacter sp. UWB15]
MNLKTYSAYVLKCFGVLALFIFGACGDSSSAGDDSSEFSDLGEISSESSETSSESVESSGNAEPRQVESIYELGKCGKDNSDERVYVISEKAYYLCTSESKFFKWVKESAEESSSSAKQSSSSKVSSSSVSSSSVKRSSSSTVSSSSVSSSSAKQSSSSTASSSSVSSSSVKRSSSSTVSSSSVSSSSAKQSSSSTASSSSVSSSSVKRSSSSVSVSSSSVNACASLATDKIYTRTGVLSGKPFVCESNTARLATKQDTLKLDTIGICKNFTDISLRAGLYSTTKYVCSSYKARVATASEISQGIGCTTNIGGTNGSRICSAEGVWRDSTASEKIVRKVCTTKNDGDNTILGSSWTCSGTTGRWWNNCNGDGCYIGPLYDSYDVVVGYIYSKGSQLWTIPIRDYGGDVYNYFQDFVRNFTEATNFCKSLGASTGSVGGNFHLATEDDWKTLINYNKEFDSSYKNLYKYFIRASNFYSNSQALNKCSFSSSVATTKCADNFKVFVWTSKKANSITSSDALTYSIRDISTISGSEPVELSPSGYQQSTTSKIPFYCVMNNYTGTFK